MQHHITFVRECQVHGLKENIVCHIAAISSTWFYLNLTFIFPGCHLRSDLWLRGWISATTIVKKTTLQHYKTVSVQKSRCTFLLMNVLEELWIHKRAWVHDVLVRADCGSRTREQHRREVLSQILRILYSFCVEEWELHTLWAGDNRLWGALIQNGFVKKKKNTMVLSPQCQWRPGYWRIESTVMGPERWVDDEV